MFLRQQYMEPAEQKIDDEIIEKVQKYYKFMISEYISYQDKQTHSITLINLIVNTLYEKEQITKTSLGMNIVDQGEQDLSRPLINLDYVYENINNPRITYYTFAAQEYFNLFMQSRGNGDCSIRAFSFQIILNAIFDDTRYKKLMDIINELKFNSISLDQIARFTQGKKINELIQQSMEADKTQNVQNKYCQHLKYYLIYIINSIYSSYKDGLMDKEKVLSYLVQFYNFDFFDLATSVFIRELIISKSNDQNVFSQNYGLSAQQMQEYKKESNILSTEQLPSTNKYFGFNYFQVKTQEKQSSSITQGEPVKNGGYVCVFNSGDVHTRIGIHKDLGFEQIQQRQIEEKKKMFQNIPDGNIDNLNYSLQHPEGIKNFYSAKYKAPNFYKQFIYQAGIRELQDTKQKLYDNFIDKNDGKIVSDSNLLNFMQYVCYYTRYRNASNPPHNARLDLYLKYVLYVFYKRNINGEITKKDPLKEERKQFEQLFDKYMHFTGGQQDDKTVAGFSAKINQLNNITQLTTIHQLHINQDQNIIGQHKSIYEYYIETGNLQKILEFDQQFHFYVSVADNILAFYFQLIFQSIIQDINHYNRLIEHIRNVNINEQKIKYFDELQQAVDNIDGNEYKYLNFYIADILYYLYVDYRASKNEHQLLFYLDKCFNSSIFTQIIKVIFFSISDNIQIKSVCNVFNYVNRIFNCYVKILSNENAYIVGLENQEKIQLLFLKYQGKTYACFGKGFEQQRIVQRQQQIDRDIQNQKDNVKKYINKYQQQSQNDFKVTKQNFQEAIKAVMFFRSEGDKKKAYNLVKKIQQYVIREKIGQEEIMLAMQMLDKPEKEEKKDRIEKLEKKDGTEKLEKKDGTEKYMIQKFKKPIVTYTNLSSNSFSTPLLSLDILPEIRSNTKLVQIIYDQLGKCIFFKHNNNQIHEILYFQIIFWQLYEKSYNTLLNKLKNYGQIDLFEKLENKYTNPAQAFFEARYIASEKYLSLFQQFIQALVGEKYGDVTRNIVENLEVKLNWHIFDDANYNISSINIEFNNTKCGIIQYNNLCYGFIDGIYNEQFNDYSIASQIQRKFKFQDIVPIDLEPIYDFIKLLLNQENYEKFEKIINLQDFIKFLQQLKDQNNFIYNLNNQLPRVKNNAAGEIIKIYQHIWYILIFKNKEDDKSDWLDKLFGSDNSLNKNGEKKQEDFNDNIFRREQINRIDMIRQDKLDSISSDSSLPQSEQSSSEQSLSEQYLSDQNLSDQNLSDQNLSDQNLSDYYEQNSEQDLKENKKNLATAACSVAMFSGLFATGALITFN